MTRDIQPQCKCKTMLAKVNASDSATTVCDRTCRKCGAKWRVIVRPNISRKPGVGMFPVELTCMADATKKK